MSKLNPAEQAQAVRRGSGLFQLDRGLIEVRGGDRVRWLNGMISNDVAALAPGPETSGCYALLLTRPGRIVADFHVLVRPECFWLETARGAVPGALEALEKFIVADDVELIDRSATTLRLGLEGPNSTARITAATGEALDLRLDASAEIEIAGVSAFIAAYGFGGGPALQIFIQDFKAIKKEKLDGFFRALEASGGPLLDAETLEILRIEGGVPSFGNELGEDVLPAEARLERAISTTKGCYTGQEVVERMRSRGRVGHLLVGLACEVAPPAPGSALHELASDSEKRVGEVTSSCHSKTAGPIALAFVRFAHSAPGTALAVAGQRVEVVDLPFVDVGTAPRL
jgi:folate-binding protein YgfZ